MGGFDCLGHQLKIPTDEGVAFIYCNTKRTEWQFGVSCAFSVLNTLNTTHAMDGGAWWATVHGVAKSQTQLK